MGHHRARVGAETMTKSPFLVLIIFAVAAATATMDPEDKWVEATSSDSKVQPIEDMDEGKHDEWTEATTEVTTTAWTLKHGGNPADLVSWTPPYPVQCFNVAPGTTEAECFCPRWDARVIHIQIPSPVERLPNEAFRGCKNFDSIAFPDTLTYIGDHAFAETNLQGESSMDYKIQLPKSLRGIGSYAFYRSGLTSIDIPPQTVLGSHAFYAAHDLASVTLHEGMKNIGTGAFMDCHMLKSIHIPSTVETIGKQAFSSARELRSINFPAGLKSIGSEAFWNAQHLVVNDIPNLVVNGKQIKGLDIPASTAIASDAFLMPEWKRSVSCAGARITHEMFRKGRDCNAHGGTECLTGCGSTCMIATDCNPTSALLCARANNDPNNSDCKKAKEEAAKATTCRAGYQGVNCTERCNGKCDRDKKKKTSNGRRRPAPKGCPYIRDMETGKIYYSPKDTKSKGYCAKQKNKPGRCNRERVNAGCKATCCCFIGQTCK